MQQPIRIISRSNKRLYADAIPGHFATNHSHINYYIDMSEIKHNMAMALEAARSIAFHFSSISVDTLLCLEGTEYIGAYIAKELANSGIGSLNTNKAIYLVEPDSNVNGQFMFADNLRPMIEHRNVLVLVNTASTGQTLSQTRECIEYYGGRVAGYSALFSNISELDGKPVFSLFSGADFPHYHNFVRGKNCPACAASVPLDAIVTPARLYQTIAQKTGRLSLPVFVFRISDARSSPAACSARVFRTPQRHRLRCAASYRLPCSPPACAALRCKSTAPLCVRPPSGRLPAPAASLPNQSDG